MSSFPHRRAARRRLRFVWMLALYAAFVTSVGLSADRAAFLAQVQALSDGDRPAAAPSSSGRVITQAAIAGSLTRNADVR
ncbi:MULTISPECIES: hypothetical protein [unclassified Lysobacter]|uniref:hypothetical protein n=1 Tax=unclassified Lysobacter TaxID=2635362 RepID=UPI001BEC7D59|nr:MULTISPECIES: hypothetical protein [unclassified Lysobacter]MBT2745841.1 hypothetical protein [Lysobacter sp. ISL-42]MBT2749600.1 hypothetical protein [Lysobacter sp. ISL-50]MBT2778756.1 hypothetical protein [Lysobacter sp. ISL-54]MBT2781351.1 hypothetical protein [Lysobacter sp. ISL-52]